MQEQERQAKLEEFDEDFDLEKDAGEEEEEFLTVHQKRNEQVYKYLYNCLICLLRSIEGNC